jgi:predicted transcriptional regulator
VARVVVAGHQLPAAEAQVLKVLLKAGSPLAASEVQARLKGRPRAHTTVLALLGRLVERRLVDREPDGRATGTSR